jgi:CheY-like chemotaxis protein
MPVMNGFEAARILKKFAPLIPLLMFTSTDVTSVEQEAESAGISAVVLKSEGAEQLLKKANALLDRDCSQ